MKTLLAALTVAAVAVLGAAIVHLATPAALAQQTAPAPATSAERVSPEQLAELAPQTGYLAAREDLDDPLPPLGGPLRITVRQEGGPALVAMPDYRRLDPDIFGIPALPRAYGGTPLINGVPPAMREVEGGRYTRLAETSPYGDSAMRAREGQMTLEAVDATATDAATSLDEVRFRATVVDGEGNTYEIICDNVIAHGVEFPSFGGVVTNHLVHGFTGIGTPLMPTTFAYAAFWGRGELRRNGQVTDNDVLVQGMLTEYTRRGDALVLDGGVTPTRLHFHVIVPPVRIGEDGRLARDAIRTGYLLPDGTQLPFWHIAFDDVEIEARHLMRAGVADRRTGDDPRPADDAWARPDIGDGELAAREDAPSGEARPAAAVGMTDAFRYIPERVTVRVGDTVLWTNDSNTPHTVTADPRRAANPASVLLPRGAEPFDSGNLAPGATFRHAFTAPGTYRYFCIPHEAMGMVGEVIVTPARQ